ncbi:DUF6314 family protein [Curtobacterium sp. VKM Ac-2922]|uniref:DUF6314 family protein n=1 Tax=Curtobacterium sp. VKM Ac-2922 TaxID=2929475 RepID=UPI001FB37D40|nr:DUF6314 family protein [Curtobacterium sp. VKM Ac-2922]MCJ1715920.1 DUF6314 family protein [Curtobacterium sp. VKM Ac-2922]
MVQPTDLVGTWTLHRTVEDRRADASGVVTGSTELRSTGPDEVVWTETGTMVLAGRATPVSRTLLVRRAPDGVWRVHFADGRVFHDWVWSAPVDHACAPDAYTGELSGDTERWTVRWQARGPAKDYRLDSVLEGRTGAAD